MDENLDETETRGGQMSFLEHLDELRKRLVNSAIIVVIAFIGCWFASKYIYNFLAVPIVAALNEAARQDVPLTGLKGNEPVMALNTLRVGDGGKFVFEKPTKFGTAVVQPGASVEVVVAEHEGKLSLFTDEAIYTVNAVVPKGVKLPVDLASADPEKSIDEQLIVTTTQESFTLYVTVALYTAIAVSIPLLLIQVWGFISPALHKHERAYVTPFVLLSTISFVGGVAFAYYIIFPPAVRYLLGLAEDFRPLLRATDYFDLIIIIMLAMGLIFQMPAITYVLSRIGLVSAGLLARSWKIAIVVILIVAAVVSPTGDIPNLMLFAAPMTVLYVFSIGIAWFFGKKRTSEMS